MAKVIGSPFPADRRPVFGDVVQWHPSGVVATVKTPRNPQSPRQQQQRLRVAVMNEALRLMGSRWHDFWIQFLSDPSRPRWHQAWVQVGARKVGFVTNRYNAMVAGLSVVGLNAWDAAAAGVGVSVVSVEGGESRSPGLIVLRLIASIYESSVDFEPGLASPNNSNSSAWMAAYVS
jgi:hypothetical protein